MLKFSVTSISNPSRLPVGFSYVLYLREQRASALTFGVASIDVFTATVALEEAAAAGSCNGIDVSTD